jgi:dipeptidyl aminopeptidase/acylaminoacyl peptidase
MFAQIRPLTLFLVATALLGSPPATEASGPGRALTVDDVLALRDVSGPKVCPDGQWVAYVVEQVDADKDEKVSNVHMVSSDGNEHVQMTSLERSASNPQWSPDGRYLSFLARKAGDDDAETQVWTLDRRGGEAQAWTNVEQGVSDYGWAPDGQSMWLLVKDMSAEQLEAKRAKAAGEEPSPLPWVIDRLQFKRDGTTYLDRSRTHIYVVHERNGTPLQLTFGDYDDSAPTWRPDGKVIAFVSNRTAEPDNNNNSDIWIVSATGEQTDRKPRQVTQNPGADYAPAFSPDGKTLAYVTVTEPDLIWYATNHLAVIPARGGKPEVLTEALDRNVAAPRYSADGRSIYFLLEDSAEQHLAAFDTRTGSVSRPIEGQLSVSSFDMNAAGDIAVTLSAPHLPTEVFLLQGGDHRRLSYTNESVMNAVNLGEVRNVSFPSKDGTVIEGFIVTPPDYEPGRRYPTLLRIHGGPVSQYDFSFSAEAQLLAANGYVVVRANPRGSSGYGQDFSAALWANWGNPDFDDVMAAVDFAIDEGYADPERLGVGGWSYGGILTNYVITKTERFKGAITGASEVLYIANYGHDHYQHEWEKELGLPWENRELWEAISPYNNVDKVSTPTLIMGGKEDWNVPINNSELLYQSLKRRGIDTELVVYPGESHGIARPSFIRDRYQRYLDWYASRVRGQ